MRVRAPLLLVLATAALLLPFAGKAFHVDDPLFLRVARQVQSHPLDFYGFTVNWYGAEMPMSEVTKNPPLASYYLAAAAGLAGWGERALHLAFLVPAAAAVLGTHALARSLCGAPALAALLALVTPAFLVSATSVMSDTMLVAFSVWAAALWTRGLARGSPATLAAAALLAGLAALSKYYGATLVPLLLAQGWAERRRPGRWALWLLLPLGALTTYHGATAWLYGRGLVLDAGAYAGAFRAGTAAPLWAGALTATVFAGGGLATISFYAPWCWSRRAIGLALTAGAALALVLAHVGRVGGFPLVDAGGPRWDVLVQLSLWAVAGFAGLALAVDDLRRRRDAGSVLLGLWVIGTLAFAGLVNWSVNARSILPMAPAAAILLVRRLEHRAALGAGRVPRWPLVLPLAAGAALALWVAEADRSLAHSARQAATVIHRVFGGGAVPIRFEGHWGFQHYMEAQGARAADWASAPPAPGAFLVVPSNNTNTSLGPAGALVLHRIVEVPSPRLMATMSREVGAGFYSDVWGPLPFALGRVPPERYHIFRVTAPPGQAGSAPAAAERPNAATPREPRASGP